jgi:hypothetical protein
MVNSTYQWLDLTARDRHEDWEQPPGRSDGPPMSWLRHHPAQPRGGPGQRLVRFALACPLEDAGHLGQQVGPAPASARSSASAAASSSPVSGRHLARCRASPVS